MRIEHLTIPSFKNLTNLKLLPEDSAAQVIIGQNASGKSNLLEAMVMIFRHLDLAEPAPFDYALKYTCRKHRVMVSANSGYISISVKADGAERAKKIKQDDFARQAKEYLPDQIFAYYSGRNERLEQLFFEHQKQQYLNLRGRIVQTEEGEFEFKSGDVLLRRLFYCRNEHSQLILLAFLIELERMRRKGHEETIRKDVILLKEYLHISGIESALFVLRKPRELPIDALNDSDTDQVDAEIPGDERFWNASGVIAEFLATLWKNALAPIGEQIKKPIDFRGHTQELETTYLYLDKEHLIKAAEETGDVNVFFRQLEAVYMADYLDEVRIQVQREGAEKPLFVTELSEGEQQLMTVLGLLQFTRNEESLFLLDEPDTHLNPIWKYNYFKLMIDDVLGSEEEFLRKNQLFISTHDPLMLGTLLKNQVFVLGESPEGTTVEHPYQNPRGMGFTNLLRSEMFGLRSTIDLKTLEDLDKRNQLIAKRAKDGLIAKEEEELRQLQERLDELGFGHEARDPLYQLFIERMYKLKKLPLDQILSEKQISKQEKIADKIIKELIHQEKMGELSELEKEILAEFKGQI